MKNRTSNAVAIEDADGVVRIDRGDQPVAGVVDRLEVPRRDEAGHAGDGEVLRCDRHAVHLPLPTRRDRPSADASTAASCGAVTRSE